MPNSSLRLLTVVVQRKRGKAVLDAALAAGATGATYFYAQGTGVREKLGLLGALIEAEKQVILLVCSPQNADAVFAAATKAGELDKPGHGFAFVQEVLGAVGFEPAVKS